MTPKTPIFVCAISRSGVAHACMKWINSFRASVGICEKGCGGNVCLREAWP